MNKDITCYATCNLRSKKNGRGFIFVFMLKNGNIPFINIYYFNDNTYLHQHFIINIEGRLEVAHDNYIPNWTNRKRNIHDSEFEFIFMHQLMIERMHEPGKNHETCILYSDEKYKTYMFLIQKAVSEYTGNCTSLPITSLLTILKSNIELPKSDLKKEKKSIVKRKVLK